MLKRIPNNEDGVVFVTVLVLVISMMILAVTIINLQLNQATLSEREIARIRSELVATGALQYYIAHEFSNNTVKSFGLSETLNGVLYDIHIDNDDTVAGPNNTNTMTITVDF